MAEVVAENGYANTPVAAVLTRAGVSRETFYQHFANKEDCFLSAYDAAAAIVLGAAVKAEMPADADALERVDAALARYLAVLASEPVLARTFMVEVYGAGAAALERRVAIQKRFTEAIVALTGARGEEERFACHALVSTVIGLVTQQICSGETVDLEALHAPLMRFVATAVAATGLM